MNISFKLSIASLLLASGLWGQKVEVGYDKNTDFSQYRSYSWMREIAAQRPVLAMHIVGTIDEELMKKGLQKVESNSDLLLDCNGGIDPQGGFATSDPTYSAWGGIPPPDANVWGGTMTPVPLAMVQEGVLVVHMLDAKEKRLVWQAKVKTHLDYEHKEKALEQVNKAVARLFKKYPPTKH
jgi:hypothetical protein